MLFMKKVMLSFLVVSLFISCKKNTGTNNGNPAPSALEHYPQKWLLTHDASPDKYTYLEVAGNNMKRSEVLKSYSLIQLALDDLCEFHVELARSEYGNKICHTLQLDRQRKRWLFAALSTNKQEVHLGSKSSNSDVTDPGGDGYKFFIHNFAKVNGVKTVAIESVDQPGYYLSTSGPGFNYSPTQVVLTKEVSPDKATHWQCR